MNIAIAIALGVCASVFLLVAGLASLTAQSPTASTKEKTREMIIVTSMFFLAAASFGGCVVVLV